MCLVCDKHLDLLEIQQRYDSMYFDNSTDHSIDNPRLDLSLLSGKRTNPQRGGETENPVPGQEII